MAKPIRNMRGAVVVWLVSYIFFLFTLANNFSASHDSINYLLHITRGENLFHQHHLLYHFLANRWWLLFVPALPALPDHYIIESFTAFWGSLNLAVCYLFFRNRFNLPVTLSIAGISLVAFSYGAWFYSVNIEVYTPPLFFILCALYIITRSEFRDSDVVNVALLQSAAILFHQVNVLFTIVVLFWLCAMKRKRFGSLARYATVTAVLCFAVYFYAGWFVEKQNTPEQFANWVLGYTKGHSYWQSLSFKTPLNVAVGFSRAFIGGHFAFELPFLKNALENSFHGHGLRDEMFLVRNMSASTAGLLTTVALFFGATMIVLLIRFARRYRNMTLHFHIINPLLITIAVYSLFFCFWMPEILEFWILQMVLVWLLVVGMLPAIRFPFRLSLAAGTAVLAACLFIVNYYGSMRWLKELKNDWYFVEVKSLDASLTKEDVVILEGEWILKDYARYYSKATVIATDEPGYSKPQAEEIVNRALAADHKVYLHKKTGEQTSWVLIQSY